MVVLNIPEFVGSKVFEYIGVPSYFKSNSTLFALNPLKPSYDDKNSF